LNRAKIASGISAVMNAPLLTLATFLPLVYLYGGERWPIYLTVSSLFGSVLPLVGVYVLLKRGYISDFYADKREERFLPFLSTIFCYLVGTLALIYLKAPAPITALMACYIINGVVLATITLKWKISIHASGVTSPVTALVYLLGSRLTPLFLLVLPVMWARMELKAHSKWQLTLGAILSSLLTWIQMAFYINHIFL